MLIKGTKKIILLGMCLFLGACAMGNFLTSKTIEEREFDSEVFNVILYGGKHANDIETVAFLDIEGDAYKLVPFGARFNFTEYAGQEGWEAYNTAKEFVSSHRSFKRAELREIKGPEGEVIGYEVRPLYRPEVFGIDDVLDVTYELTAGNVVQIYVRLQERVERWLKTNDR